MTSINLYVSGEYPCGYLEKHIARSAFVHPTEIINNELYSDLIALGFRRSGNNVYRPSCPSCNACIPTRLKVSEFLPNRSQKRCIARNQKTEVVIKQDQFDVGQFALYKRYLASRHNEQGIDELDADDFMGFLGSHWGNTHFVEFRNEGTLFAVAVVDHVENGLSAVYTFFDPDFSDYSPGVYAVLWQIEHARQLKLDWLYLGFWIKKCQKMAYKSNYQPLQLFDGKQWVDYQRVEDETV
jgi:arginyl-tRNA--protein-N-Asp/Glu arginylyltransferase